MGLLDIKKSTPLSILSHALLIVGMLLIQGCSVSIRATATKPISEASSVLAPTISYPSSSYSITVGASTTITATASSVSNTTISPALPAGLTLTDGVISGSPTAGSPLTTYTITAYNSVGVSTTTTLQIVVRQPYEYLYYGDQNGTSLYGFSIDPSTGNLTELSSAMPAYWVTSGPSFVLNKISDSLQFLYINGQNGLYGYSIDPPSGSLTQLSGSGNSQNLTSFMLDLSGLFLYAVDNNSNGNAWTYPLSLTNGTIGTGTQSSAFPGGVNNAYMTTLSPDGKYIYFTDPVNNIVSGFSISNGVLTPIVGTNSGDGTNPGDVTYAETILPNPSGSGGYGNLGRPYLDAAINVIYFTYYDGSSAYTLVPYKIGADGSLTAAATTSEGTSPTIAGDLSGKYLYRIGAGTAGIYSYSIGSTGAITILNGGVPYLPGNIG